MRWRPSAAHAPHSACDVRCNARCTTAYCAEGGRREPSGVEQSLRRHAREHSQRSSSLARWQRRDAATHLPLAQLLLQLVRLRERASRLRRRRLDCRRRRRRCRYGIWAAHDGGRPVGGRALQTREDRVRAAGLHLVGCARWCASRVSRPSAHTCRRVVVSGHERYRRLTAAEADVGTSTGASRLHEPPIFLCGHETSGASQQPRGSRADPARSVRAPLRTYRAEARRLSLLRPTEPPPREGATPWRVRPATASR